MKSIQDLINEEEIRSSQRLEELRNKLSQSQPLDLTRPSENIEDYISSLDDIPQKAIKGLGGKPFDQTTTESSVPKATPAPVTKVDPPKSQIEKNKNLSQPKSNIDSQESQQESPLTTIKPTQNNIVEKYRKLLEEFEKPEDDYKEWYNFKPQNVATFGDSAGKLLALSRFMRGEAKDLDLKSPMMDEHLKTKTDEKKRYQEVLSKLSELQKPKFQNIGSGRTMVIDPITGETKVINPTEKPISDLDKAKMNYYNKLSVRGDRQDKIDDRFNKSLDRQNKEFQTKGIIDLRKQVFNGVWKDKYKQDLGTDTVNALIAAAKEGNATAFNSVGTKMAKAMGEVGALTENDVTRYVKTKKLDQKAGDALKLMIDGKPSNLTLNEITQITKVLKERSDEAISPIFRDAVTSAVTNYGVTPYEAYQRMGFPIPSEVNAVEKYRKEKGINSYQDAFNELNEKLKASGRNPMGSHINE